MPFYRDLDPDDPQGARTIERLLALRRQFASGEHAIPPKTLDDTLLIATWNLRNFDTPAYGSRTPEAIQYIAEIIDRFDIVALQEVDQDLTALRRLLDVLGPMWKFLATDVTEGDAGNRERLVFLFDSRKVRLGGVVGELVLPGNVRQISRTPYLVSFVAGWARFFVATVHIAYGEGAAGKELRRQEIGEVAQLLHARTLNAHSWSRNMILLGDFNIDKETDPTADALREASFQVPEKLMGQFTNISRTKQYDQIAFHVDEDRLQGTGRAGVFDYYDTVFKADDDHRMYAPDGFVKQDGTAPIDQQAYYRRYWRTHQMSDHLPLWCELRIDYSERYLMRKIHGETDHDSGVVTAEHAGKAA